MPEAVIVDAVRTPIGRAVKGSLKDVRADDLAAVPLKALRRAQPGGRLPPDRRRDDGLRLPARASRATTSAATPRCSPGIDHHVPATTVNRFCASSLQTLRMAFHAIKAGEGDQYIAAGVEAVSRFGGATASSSTRSSTAPRARSYNVYIPMGLTAENVAERCKRLARGAGRVGRDLAAARRRRPRLRPLRPRDRRA